MLQNNLTYDIWMSHFNVVTVKHRSSFHALKKKIRPCALVKANMPAMCIVVQVRQGKTGEQIQQEAFSKLLTAQPPLSQI